ncbi:hypothetical protein IPH92_00950 [Candidatus Kaiserbacteria bacterium]|nr:MAG: hypothetical protein IPH92_00950 [Candidatus Kaiserbacteria bacterium]
MELGMFSVSGHVVLYACCFIMAMAILYACETLPHCVSPRLLSPHSKGNSFVVGTAMFLMYFGFFGIVTLMIPAVSHDLSMAFAIAGGFLSFCTSEKYK